MNTKYRIIIIEPSPVLRQGLKSMLEEHSDFAVIRMYDNLQSFVKTPLNASFNFILVNPAVVNFYETFSARKVFADYPDAILVAVYYSYIDGETLNRFDGALDIYQDGATMASRLRQLAIALKPAPAADDVELTKREKQMLVAIAQGLTNKEIADRFCLSPHTIVSHRKNITRKTGIKTVAGLTVYAVFNNLITQQDAQNLLHSEQV